MCQLHSRSPVKHIPNCTSGLQNSQVSSLSMDRAFPWQQHMWPSCHPPQGLQGRYCPPASWTWDEGRHSSLTHLEQEKKNLGMKASYEATENGDPGPMRKETAKGSGPCSSQGRGPLLNPTCQDIGLV